MEPALSAQHLNEHKRCMVWRIERPRFKDAQVARPGVHGINSELGHLFLDPSRK